MTRSLKSEATHLVVGAGRMGGALISGWIKNDPPDVSPKNIIILDPRPGNDAAQCISQGARHITETNEIITSVDFVLLAIKPQMFESLAPSIATHLKPGTLIISILAGTPLTALSKTFPKQSIIRAMPNTPASIGAGITAFTCGPNVSEQQRQSAHKLLSAGGKVHQVENEHLIDVVTAVSGSGPAYFFHMVEALEKAAINIGLPKDLAPDFARQTLIGAGALLGSTEQTASELRQAVTSPKGTTEAALDVLMQESNLPSLMRDTLDAALNRAKDLAQD